MLDTLPLLRSTDFPALKRDRLTTLQVNLGYRCNQSCLHCHVNAGPKRTEMMDDAQVDLIPRVLAARGLVSLDLTGGAPELHGRFRWLVRAARDLGVKVIDRCNLTILSEPGHEDLADFLAEQGLEVVASLPCYLEDNVDTQRGKGVYARSIAGLQRLNALGYGQPGSGLVLNLVYNPGGPSLPPAQAGLEAAYKRELAERHGIVFDRLYSLANMPILRFGSTLLSRGQFHDYLALLKASHNPANLDGVMCRELVSVDWRGRLYDCDFNQMLGLAMEGPATLADLLDADPADATIRVAGHCYGCTAGQGSSCGGALEDAGCGP
ncbi:MAG: radical SAM protein [bacterium]|jgi:radical SAM/Cys-rich protein|nr:MAG: radical SAM protein [bacterium]KAF0147334.1 MAG: radical SAM protein [bacterium]KAF0165512.1 MAG: radical SAM protein [bacterium]TXT16379.1 MAG: radical SAM protein [bacterium]